MVAQALFRGGPGGGVGPAPGYDRTRAGQRRNGKVSKQVCTSEALIDVESSRDHSSRFEPQNIKKRETVLAENLEPHILSINLEGHKDLLGVYISKSEGITIVDTIC